ncbi:AcrR family transcriptional regulator [Paenibacillus jamilae]|uniref:TetR/AcrR family transcriptional regulator n=1 Tax=Paenibacillus TaxID=44249 RepID=UPI001FAB3F6D|nr:MULTISPECIES: TetR/AcrR family transcriptional regulator [Paenibacillus]MBZ6442592.1 TetR/AcrR family transcriptional regulator [Paenibacillus polymyxa]MDP9677123.1 AcrR family transcriptional regulator [Paenibacillus jamilae]MEE4564761.1 TetR/AcrR family transcriptional regulator [Paenibacillus polymyxa]
MSSKINNCDKMNETRNKLITKILPYFRKNDLQSARMDEIAKVMEISRATLYKYFSTKEEIILYIVDGFVDYMNELTSNSLDSDQNFGIRFQQIFEQSVLLVEYFTDVFLNELENSYPDSYDRLNEAMKQREQQVLTFYEEGVRKGIFYNINGKLLIMQDELLRSLFNVKYLMTNQITIQQILYDYYQLKKIQLFKPEKISAVDDEVMMPRIEYLAQKIIKNLF